MIVRARAVVTMEGAPIPNGAVAVEGGRIVAVGSWAEVRAQQTGDIIDLGECALLPGLINAHCHLEYTMMRGGLERPASFTAWIKEINAWRGRLTVDDYAAAIALGFSEALRFGTTTLVNLTGFPQLRAQFLHQPIQTWWCPELIDVRAPVDVVTALEFEGGEKGLGPHALYSASPGLIERCEEIARRDDLLLTTHIAESREETEMFRDGRGSLFDLLAAMGRPMDDCGRQTPLGRLSSLACLDDRWLLTHLNDLSPKDLDLVAGRAAVNVVHCPRSHAYFRHPPFQLEALQRCGANICLGTDSLASNVDLSLFAEMRALSEATPNLAPIQLLEMATVNGARALRRHESVGQLRPGFRADLVAVPVPPGANELLESVVGFTGDTPWIMVGGEVVGLS